MINNYTELGVTLNQLQILEEALIALKEELQSINPELLMASAPAYKKRIEKLQREIADYIYQKPAALSIILPERNNNFATARNAVPETSSQANQKF